jgi:hypothetical protein
MSTVIAHVKSVLDFLKRQPDLDGSHLLKKESAALLKAVEKYLSRAEEIELSLCPDYLEAQALLEGEGKTLATVSFIKAFSRKHCSRSLAPVKADKKARSDLLLLAAADKRLSELKTALDPSKEFRDLMATLLKMGNGAITEQVLAMPAARFRCLVDANGLDAGRTAGGSVSTSKAARQKVVEQILHIKASDRTLSDLVRGR